MGGVFHTTAESRLKNLVRRVGLLERKVGHNGRSSAVAARRQGGTGSTTIPSTTSDFDPGSLLYSHGGVTINGTGLEAPIAGVYHLGAGIRLTSTGSTGQFQLRLQVNSLVVASASADPAFYMNNSTSYPLNAGDVVRIQLYNAGDPVLAQPSLELPYLSISLEGRL